MISDIAKFAEEFCQLCACTVWRKKSMAHPAGCSCPIYLKLAASPWHPNIRPKEIVNGKCLNFKKEEK